MHTWPKNCFNVFGKALSLSWKVKIFGPLVIEDDGIEKEVRGCRRGGIGLVCGGGEGIVIFFPLVGENLEGVLTKWK